MEKLQCNSCRICRNLAAAAVVGKSTMHQLLRKDLGVKPFKMLCQQELSDRHVAVRAEKCRKHLQDIAEGMLPNLVFTDKKKFDIQQAVNQKNDRVWVSSFTTEGRIVTRCQNLQSVMMWTVVTATGRSLLLFVTTGVKLNSEQYVLDILGVVCSPGPSNTSKTNCGPSNRIWHPPMVQNLPNHGF